MNSSILQTMTEEKKMGFCLFCMEDFAIPNGYDGFCSKEHKERFERLKYCFACGGSFEVEPDTSEDESRFCSKRCKESGKMILHCTQCNAEVQVEDSYPSNKPVFCSKQCEDDQDTILSYHGEAWRIKETMKENQT